MENEDDFTFSAPQNDMENEDDFIFSAPPMIWKMKTTFKLDQTNL